MPGVSPSFYWESAAPEDEDEVRSLLAELRSDFPNARYSVTARFGYDNWDVYDFDESYDGASLSETDNVSERLGGFDKIADADPELLSDLADFLGYEDEDDLIEQVGDPDYLADEIENMDDEEEGPALLKRYNKAFWGK